MSISYLALSNLIYRETFPVETINFCFQVVTSFERNNYGVTYIAHYANHRVYNTALPNGDLSILCILRESELQSFDLLKKILHHLYDLSCDARSSLILVILEF